MHRSNHLLAAAGPTDNRPSAVGNCRYSVSQSDCWVRRQVSGADPTVEIELFPGLGFHRVAARIDDGFRVVTGPERLGRRLHVRLGIDAGGSVRAGRYVGVAHLLLVRFTATRGQVMPPVGLVRERQKYIEKLSRAIELIPSPCMAKTRTLESHEP